MRIYFLQCYKSKETASKWINFNNQNSWLSWVQSEHFPQIFDHDSRWVAAKKKQNLHDDLYHMCSNRNHRAHVCGAFDYVSIEPDHVHIKHKYSKAKKPVSIYKITEYPHKPMWTLSEKDIDWITFKLTPFYDNLKIKKI